MRKIFLYGTAIILVFGAWRIFKGYQADEKRMADHPCITDWKQCKDTKELVEFSHAASDGQVQCTVYADNNLKYGAPEWPSFLQGPKFGAYLQNEDFKRSGEVTLIQQGALIPNAYGGKEKSTMFCKYNMGSEKITSFEVQ